MNLLCSGLAGVVAATGSRQTHQQKAVETSRINHGPGDPSPRFPFFLRPGNGGVTLIPGHFVTRGSPSVELAACSVPSSTRPLTVARFSLASGSVPLLRC